MGRQVLAGAKDQGLRRPCDHDPGAGRVLRSRSDAALWRAPARGHAHLRADPGALEELAGLGSAHPGEDTWRRHEGAQGPLYRLRRHRPVQPRLWRAAHACRARQAGRDACLRGIPRQPLLGRLPDGRQPAVPGEGVVLIRSESATTQATPTSAIVVAHSVQRKALVDSAMSTGTNTSGMNDAYMTARRIAARRACIPVRIASPPAIWK